MNNDPISTMSETEIQEACYKVLDKHSAYAPTLVGLIIEKLQEWGCGFRYYPNSEKWNIYHLNTTPMKPFEVFDPSLQVAFLRTAQALGHWSPPKKVEEKFEYLRRKSDGAVRHLKEFNPEFREDWERVTVIPYNDSYAFIPQK